MDSGILNPPSSTFFRRSGGASEPVDIGTSYATTGYNCLSTYISTNSQAGFTDVPLNSDEIEADGTPRSAEEKFGSKKIQKETRRLTHELPYKVLAILLASLLLVTGIIYMVVNSGSTGETRKFSDDLLNSCPWNRP